MNRLLLRGYTEVVDADLSGYFDSIPHVEFMKPVSARISDGRIPRPRRCGWNTGGRD